MFFGKSYDPNKMSDAVKKLAADPYVTKRKGIFEFRLGGSVDAKLLEIRVFLAAAVVKEKTSRHRQKEKNMKLEEVSLKTKEAVDYLAQSLESGQSAILTQYLGAMAEFRNDSFGNIMLFCEAEARRYSHCKGRLSGHRV